MATADELRAQIAARRQEVEVAKTERLRAIQEMHEADGRQQLRRELEQVCGALTDESASKEFFQNLRRQIDRDEAGTHMRDERYGSKPARAPSGHSDQGHAKSVQSYLDCVEAVQSGEIEWSLKGFSWLRETLEQNAETYLLSAYLEVCGHGFFLCYHPEKGQMGSHNQRGSLAINHDEPSDYEGVTFRYTIWIKSKDRGYVQWGDSGNVCTQVNSQDMLFGPDVCFLPATPAGVFGMTHAELITSEWVVDDALTAKLKVEVRPNVSYVEEDKRLGAGIVVPPSKLGDKLLLLLDGGVGSDVTFIVEGERIAAHSQIISACSEVLQRQFSCGMQESTSKEVTIEDCDPMVFKAFLRYLYSDSVVSLEGFIAEKAAEQTSHDASSSSAASNANTSHGTKMSTLQQLLALSHKYQLTRLQLWCERELCDYISILDVCSVLCQAHLYEAKKLEEKCLEFIRANMSKVVATDAFGSLSQDWPQVSLKITLRVADVREGVAAAAMERQETARKRKRDD